LIKEEKILRQQKSRLEARMAILEDHNRQLEAQLDRLRQLLATETGLNGNSGRENGTNGTLQSRSHLAFLTIHPSSVVVQLSLFLFYWKFCVEFTEHLLLSSSL
jgi:hypothetical protein